MNPTPIGIQNDRASLLLATRGSTEGPRHGRVSLRSKSASLLGEDAGTQREGGESKRSGHCRFLLNSEMSD